MKVLCQYKSGGEYYRHLGFANAFRSAGYQFLFWNPKEKPVYDIFDEYKPDIFIGTTFDLDRSIIGAIKANPQTKIVLKGGNWGPSDAQIDKEKYPILFVSEKEKKILSQLKAEVGKPDLVICHYHERSLEETMSGWREIGIEPYALMNAADVCVFYKGKQDPQLSCDVSFVGGYWKYKGENLDKYISPLCSPVGKYNVKIFGNQKWSVPQFLGGIPDVKIKDLYASSLICPNVSEPHSIEFGFDVVERPFKILSSGGFLVMDDVRDFKALFGDTIRYYHSYTELVEIIEYYKKNPDKRDCKEAMKHCIWEHTYHRRIADLLMKLDFQKEATQVMGALANVL